MISTMARARARTVLGGLLYPAAMKRAHAQAAQVWSSIEPRLQISTPMGPTKRRARFARHILDADLPMPARYLEVGSFEGDSLAFVHALLKGRVRVTAIDPFENYDELPGIEMSTVERRFLANVKAIGAEVRVLRGSSVVHLPQLIAADELFDLIYIDGSHATLDVMTDAVLGWRLLAAPGLMNFDDYRLPECGSAIDAFIDAVKREAIVIEVASQVFLQRRG